MILPVTAPVGTLAVSTVPGSVVFQFVSLGVGWDCCPGEDESNHHGYKRREHAKWLIFLPSVIHCESPESLCGISRIVLKFDLAAR
jgi:hypothetical protein